MVAGDFICVLSSKSAILQINSLPEAFKFRALALAPSLRLTHPPPGWRKVDSVANHAESATWLPVSLAPALGSTA